MSIEIDSLTDETIGNFAIGAFETGLWDGRPVTWKESTDLFNEIETRLRHLLFSQNPGSPYFEKIAAPLAWIKATGETRLVLACDTVVIGGTAIESPSALPTDQRSTPTIDTYASKWKPGYTKDFASPPPFQELHLIGLANQSTVHFHCGINNNVAAILDGASNLYKKLDQQFAVHPHLIHSHGMVRGLSVVALEKIDQLKDNLLLQTVCGPFLPQLAGPVLQRTNIQKSIDYEVENLSRIAQDIIAKNNPKLKQAHVTFSNGGYVFNEALKRLSPEQRETIIVITCGTTKIIDNGMACEIRNVIGSKDWASKFCNGGEGNIENAKSKANINIIEQIETNGIIGGHYFVQPEYLNIVSEVIEKDFIGKYEIY